MFKKIMIAVDNGAPAARAACVGIELARQLNAQLALVHVVDPGIAQPEMMLAQDRLIEEMRKSGQELLERLTAYVPDAERADCFLLEGNTAETIVGAARGWEADVIVLGSEGRGRISRFVLGSTGDLVTRLASCPVLAVPLHSVLPEVAETAHGKAAARAAQHN